MSQAEKKVKKNGMEDRLALRVWGEGEGTVLSTDHWNAGALSTSI